MMRMKFICFHSIQFLFEKRIYYELIIVLINEYNVYICFIRGKTEQSMAFEW